MGKKEVKHEERDTRPAGVQKAIDELNREANDMSDIIDSLENQAEELTQKRDAIQEAIDRLQGEF